MIFAGEMIDMLMFAMIKVMHPNTFYRVSVKALIKNDQGKVLVVKENQDTWSLPGGGLDHGEDPEVCIARELREELGITTFRVTDIANLHTFYLKARQTWLLWIVYNADVKIEDFTFGDGVTAAKYIDVSDLQSSQDIFEQMVYKACSNAWNPKVDEWILNRE